MPEQIVKNVCIQGNSGQGLPDQRAEVIHQPIAAWAKLSPDACAISSPGLRPLTYEELNTQLDRVCQILHGFGLGTSDAVAVLLPNGPEAAVVTLAVASMARCAPLNPGFRARELASYFDDLNVKALIVESDDSFPAQDIARDRGIGVIKLVEKSDQTAGVFNLTCEAFDNYSNKFSHPGPPSTEDIALLLHTSGTTSRPKIVPLTHRNLCTSASNIGHALQLTPEDCCLNVMPLFHIHGLVGTLLSSLHAGASIVCCPDFVAPRVLDWLGDSPVTWYSAVPTMHQTLLERARKQSEKLSSISLRFIRSASAPLPGGVLRELEQTFSAPVVEAYGMTEAAHQITTNPLPPGERKPGSVGLGADSSVCIIGTNNHNLQAMERGEVMIRGDNVTSGYLDNEEANRNALFEGWLKTGDEGYLDKDGYLFLTGRLKEMINRGGEKIAPREIDEVLLEHPAVFQAVAFALPDDRVGEEVAAVVVTDPNVSVTAEELQEYVGERLADFKVPRRIVFTDEIPVGSTGKLQRIGLADLLGLTDEAENSPISTAESSGEAMTEQVVQDIWSEVLAKDDVNVDENFFALGGDSVLATMAMTRINKAFDVDLNIAVFFSSPTIRKLADYIEGCGSAEQQSRIKEVSREDMPDEELDPATLTGHALVAKSLKQLGITHIYGLTGTPINETIAECAHAGIRVIMVHNQSAGAQMAAVQNYTAGKLTAATIMTPGPGIANATMGALVANDNGWPLLLIGGGRRQNQRGAGVFQDFDSISIFQSITKMSALVDSIQRVPEYFQRAQSVAMNGKPGPVYLDVPEDVLFGEIEANFFSHISPHTVSKQSADATSITQAADMIGSAARPVLLIDIELRWGLDDFSLLREFIEQCECPFVTTHMARGYISDDHPLCCNRIISETCAQADLAILLGARLDWQFRFGSEISAGAKLLQICEKPDDIGMGRNPELAILSRPAEVLRQLNTVLTKSERQKPDRQAWLKELHQSRLDAKARIAIGAHKNDDPMVPERLMEEIKGCLPDNAIVIADGNACYGAVQRVIPALYPISRFTPGPDGCIGVGVPFGIGAKLTCPGQPVVIISGDTAFGLGIMEIETAVRHKLDLLIIVANNSGPSAGKAYGLYPEECADEIGMFQLDIPYHQIVESLGGRGESVVSPEEVRPAIEKALSGGGVVCINVKVAQFTPIKLR